MLSKFYYYYFIIIYLLLCSFCLGQVYSYKGELSSKYLTSNDVVKGNSDYEFGYILLPTFSIEKEITSEKFIDFEYAYKINRDFSGGSIRSSNDKNYRLWIRYSSNSIELRIGLQKIIFGPSQILRSLSWFDGYNIKDPTGQTEGVNALRYQYFMNNSFSFTSWIIKNDLDPLSIGSRINISSITGDYGLTYHRETKKKLQLIGQTGLAIENSHNRYALDYRYDGYFGFWFESVIIQKSEKSIPLGTIGIDYTIDLFNGVQILSETMVVESLDRQFSSVLLLSTSIGFLHRAIIISQVDWNNNKTYNYLQWNTSYDKFSINYTLSINPKRSTYDFDVGDKLTGFGLVHQIMFIYNY